MLLGSPTAKPILPLGDPNDTPAIMRVTSPYGIRNGTLHAAIDVGNYIAGDTLTAVGAATVVAAGYLSLPWSTQKPADSWWYAQPAGPYPGQRGGLYGPPSAWVGPVWGGKQIVLDLGSDIFAAYAHCDGVSVSAGDRVILGQTIGAVGDTGSAYRQPHLHFGLRIRGVWVDPWPYISGVTQLPDTAMEEPDVYEWVPSIKHQIPKDCVVAAGAMPLANPDGTPHSGTYTFPTATRLQVIGGLVSGGMQYWVARRPGGDGLFLIRNPDVEAWIKAAPAYTADDLADAQQATADKANAQMDAWTSSRPRIRP